MQPEKYFTDQSMYYYSAYRRLAKMAGCPAAEPCQHHTVPKRVGKTTLEQRRPRLERPLCAAIERRFQTQTDTLAEATGIPRARTTTGREAAPFDRYGIPFGNKGPMRTREGPTVRIRLPPAGSHLANLIPRPGRITGNRRFESSSLQRRVCEPSVPQRRSQICQQCSASRSRP